MSENDTPEARRYLVIFFGTFGFLALLFLFWGLAGRDHFGSVSLRGDMSWFHDYNDIIRPDMQDRDIYFHNIGKSIENAKQADIILLGHSGVLFAVDDGLIQEFERTHGVRIFNLANAGIASGEFARRIIKRWDLHPKIWIINADDVPASFFNPEMDDHFGKGRSSTLNIVKDNRITGYLHVASRNVRWFVADALKRNLPASLINAYLPRARNSQELWRNIRTGSLLNEKWPSYDKANWPPITVVRDQNCHADKQEIERARRYLDDIGGDALLMLLPDRDWCLARVREIAGALGLETIIAPDTTKYCSIDGRHMDTKSSILYTKFMLDALQKTETYKRAIRPRLH